MKKSLLLLSAVAALPLMSGAQELKKGYITWPESSELGTYIQQWNNGKGSIKISGSDAWEDMEFFTSRVKPRTRFNSTATQVYPSRVAYDLSTKQGTDKRLVYWVCIGDPMRNEVQTNALPNGLFDQEVFNMWSYVDHYGNWNCPWGWTPGAFSDAAHKNGVGVSGVAGTPFGSITDSWRSAYEKFGGIDSDMVYNFLHYFGQDGLGYNSEWRNYPPTKLISMHNALKKKMADNPAWEIMWYGGTTDSGSCAFDTGVGSTGGNTNLFESASIFLNYNWTGYMSQSVAHAKNVGRDPFRIYTGNNQQGGEGGYYSSLVNQQLSIGLWAGHHTNILWTNRSQEGSSALAKQRTYNKLNEQLFGNGPRNPAIKISVTNNQTSLPTDDWCGMSAMMNARSVLNHSVNTDPFYTFFNLGNGQFFNWKGDRQNDNQWYSLGIQDFTPTWRWWFAPTWMANTVTKGSTNLSAEFTWEDAYVGGSCLKIEGTAAEEYLHLFKTDMKLANQMIVTVRFKLLDGEGDISLRMSNPSSNKFYDLPLSTVAKSMDLQDQSYKVGADGWCTVTQSLTAGNLRAGGMNTGNMGIVGLAFKNCKNMKLLLGEFSILPNATAATPSAPKIKTAKVLANVISGVDGKLIWTMDDDAGLNAGTPVYNSDVKTSMFRTWSQQEGAEPVQIGATTSWAAHLFRCPVDNTASSRIRFGVSAVSMDTRTETAITWSDWITLPTYEVTPDITINKGVIKPGEDFTLSFVDNSMPSATWELIDAGSGASVWTGTGKSVTTSIANVGAYDLKVTYTLNGASVTKEFPRYVSITTTLTGALPEIYNLKIDDAEVDATSPDVVIAAGSPAKKFSYTGRYADGAASRGVALNEGWFGVNAAEIGLGDAGKSFSVAAWIRYDVFPEGQPGSFLTIEDRVGGGWPYNNWGYMWSRINPEGKFVFDCIDSAWGLRSTGSGTESNRIYYVFKDAKIDLNTWTHVAIIFDYNPSNSGQFRQHFYINGVKQFVTRWANCNKGEMEKAVGASGDWTRLDLLKNSSNTTGYGEDTYNPEYTSKANWPMAATYNIAFGGSSQNIAATKGSLDDFQVWGKVMDQNDITQSMFGLDKNNLPADVLGYWDFENEVSGSGTNTKYVGYAGANATNKSPNAHWWSGTHQYTETSGYYIYDATGYVSGCPMIAGEAYPIVTTPTWKVRANIANANGNGEEGSADISFPRNGDYTVTLTLANGHGSASADYPVVKVGAQPTAIEGVEGDNGGVVTYTVDSQLFLDFAEDGDYKVDVYNMSGMLVAEKDLSMVAGQTATITLGAKGVYLVKIVKDGRELRTVKVIRK